MRPTTDKKWGIATNDTPLKVNLDTHLPMPSAIPMPRIRPIAISAIISGMVMAISSPTPSYRNGNIRARVSTVIWIGIRRDITPSHGAENAPAE
jgi:hypothetical protein